MVEFKKTVLDNGIRIVTESHPYSKAVSIGLWILTGSRDESSGEEGISHFIEHLTFKGTKNRTAFEIAQSLECLGGDLNAFTSKENTCYHALILKKHWINGLEVVCDLASQMSLKKEDFALEKSVILQEIAMSEDSIEDSIYDHYFEKALRKNSLGHNILGSEETLNSMTQKQVMARYRNHYCGQNMIVSFAGDVNHDEVVDQVVKFLGRLEKGRTLPKRKRPQHSAIRLVENRPGEQVHLLMGLPSASFQDTLRFESFIVNAYLAGGMTSKFYQSIREKKGLAYTVHSQLSTFQDFGIIQVYTACEPKNMKAVLKTLSSEMKKMRRHGISKRDLEMFKTQVIGSILLGSDDVENRMQSLAVNEMVFGRYRPVDEIVGEIERVSADTVQDFLDRYFKPEPLGLLVMGKEADQFESLVKDFEF